MRPSEREHHTRLGWWLMTHDRGGAAVIGGGAALILAADVLYAVSHWSRSFSDAYLVTLGGLAACFSIALLLRLNRPVGADRRSARRRQRVANAILAIAIVAFVALGDRIGSRSGEILGLIAGLSSLFVAGTFADLVRGRTRRERSQHV